MQHAVSLAADRSSQEFAKGHTRTKSPRSVDIFAVSDTRSITSAFNEEIAARNLDTRVARASQHNDYVPTSKYQEEVAVRNSWRSSTEAPRSSGDRNHRSWISSGTESGSGGHTPHHSWSNAVQGPYRPSVVTETQHTSYQPALAEEDWPTPTYNSVNSKEQPPTDMPGEHGISSGQMGTTNAGLANYHLSRSEVSQPCQADHPSTRPSSRLSATSSQTPVINLAHRKIMDLTGSDDDDSQDQTPPTQARKGDAQATIPDQSENQQQQQEREYTADGQEPIPLGARGPSEPEDVQPAPVQVITQMAPQGQVKQQPTPKKPSSSFSIVSTLASLPPAEQAAAQPSSKPQAAARRDHVAAQLASVPTAANRLSTVNETETEVEDSAGDISTPTSPEQIEKNQGPLPSLARLPAGVSQTDDTLVAEGLRNVPQTAPKTLYTSPESLRPVDFVNPSNAFGVRTRDFAVTPSKPQPRTEREANTKAKVSKIGSGATDENTAGSVTNGYTSDALPYSFDEEAFRRKQEQARAALIKLQQSLNEEFLPPPREPPPPRPNRMNGVGQRRVPNPRTVSDPHGPVAPSSIFTQGREHAVNGTDPPDSGAAPAPSIATRVKRPDLHAQASGSSSSTVRAGGRGAHRPPLQQSQSNVQYRARSADKKGKGKEREIDIALAGLQRTANEIAGPPRAASAHGRYAHESVYDQKHRSAADGTDWQNGYGHSQKEIKRPSTSNHSHAPVPPSPGDVSLSNFPVAPHHTQAASPGPHVPRGPANHGHQHNNSIGERDFASERLRRRGSATSNASQLTSTSQYSIPFHMIPERGSSMRDSLVREEG